MRHSPNTSDCDLECTLIYVIYVYSLIQNFVNIFQNFIIIKIVILGFININFYMYFYVLLNVLFDDFNDIKVFLYLCECYKKYYRTIFSH